MPKFKRHLPDAGLEAAENVLFDEMERAVELMQSEEDYGRAAAIHAVYVCYSFLHVRGLSGQGLKPLAHLLASLQAVKEGNLPEIFDPRAKPGQLLRRKWSRSPAQREIQLYAAAMMDALMKLAQGRSENMHKKLAAACVARCSDRWAVVSQGAIKPSTIINWRDELMQRRASDSGRGRFEGLSRMFSKGPRAILEQALRTGPVLTGGVRKAKRGPQT